MRHCCAIKSLNSYTFVSSYVFLISFQIKEISCKKEVKRSSEGSQLKAATPPPRRTPLTAAYMQHTFLIMTIYLGLQYCVYTCCTPVATQLTWKPCWYWHLCSCCWFCPNSILNPPPRASSRRLRVDLSVVEKTPCCAELEMKNLTYFKRWWVIDMLIKTNLK